jgi:hypothetical protein
MLRSVSKTWQGTAIIMLAPSSASPSEGCRVRQHQIVYAALQGHMGGKLHALALQTTAPD